MDTISNTNPTAIIGGILPAPILKPLMKKVPISFPPYRNREPKGYAKENPAIEYLKLKSFVAIRRFTDEEMLEKDLLAKVVSSFSALMPFIGFLNRALV